MTGTPAHLRAQPGEPRLTVIVIVLDPGVDPVSDAVKYHSDESVPWLVIEFQDTPELWSSVMVTDGFILVAAIQFTSAADMMPIGCATPGLM